MKNIYIIQHKLMLFIFGLLFIVPHLKANPHANNPTIPESEEIAVPINPIDRPALEALYYETGGPSSWDHNTGWLNTSGEGWYGVTVDESTGRVIEIDLTNNKLDGYLPNEIGDLSELKILNLKKNRELKGTIPTTIGNLHNLEEFYLTENKMEGVLPNSIGGLNNLRILEITNITNLGGNLPISLSSLQNLEVLKLFVCGFDGFIPIQLSYLPNLTTLNLRNNNFEGKIPTYLRNITNLSYLNLSSNNFYGEIPLDLTFLSNLTYLNLSTNNLEGIILPELSILQNLEELYLDNNNFSGSIPSELGGLINLTTLSLAENDLVGVIPLEFANLTKLISILLNGNNLEGEIPNDLFNLPMIGQIEVQGNMYTFETLEDKIGLYNNMSFIYSPQAKVGQTLNVSVPFGSNYTLDIDCGGINNRYKWKFNDGVISNRGSSDLELTEVDLSNSGVYTCEITNTNVLGLTIYSLPITLDVQAGAPNDVVINGCSEEAIGETRFPYSRDNQPVSVTAFRIEGGEIVTNCPGGEDAIVISYKDVSDNKNIRDTITVTRTYTITDCNGPYDIKQTFTIVDKTNPVAKCKATLLVLDSTNNVSLSPTKFGSGSTDNCTNNLIYSLNKSDFTDDDIGNNTVTVTVTDASGNFNTCQAVVEITAYNHEPTNITLSNQDIPENEPVGTEVGIIETTDADINNSFTYQFVSGIGDEDNDLFEIVGDRLNSNAVFDFEAESGRSYSVRIESEDNGGKSISKVIRIDIIDVNETPTDITLSPFEVNENEYAGTVIGNLSTVDEDLNDNHTYSLVSGANENDNVYFSIVNNQLLSNEIFDYETKDRFVVRIKTTDSGGLEYAKTFEIIILDANDPPTAINLSNNIIKENQDIGTEIGILSTIDTDNDETFSYTLVSGEGDGNNSSFSIVGNQLVSNEEFDFETKESYTVRIQSEDKGGAAISKAFEINILNLNPEDLGVDIPDAFSPNEDGINDFYQILYIEQFPDAVINIFNRWGSLVYEKEQYGNIEVYGETDAWWDGRLRANGKMNSNVLPTGTYFVVLRLDEKKIFKGIVYLKK